MRYRLRTLLIVLAVVPPLVGAPWYLTMHPPWSNAERLDEVDLSTGPYLPGTNSRPDAIEADAARVAVGRDSEPRPVDVSRL